MEVENPLFVGEVGSFVVHDVANRAVGSCVRESTRSVLRTSSIRRNRSRGSDLRSETHAPVVFCLWIEVCSMICRILLGEELDV